MRVTSKNVDKDEDDYEHDHQEHEEVGEPGSFVDFFPPIPVFLRRSRILVLFLR